MSSVDDAVATMLRNIPEKTGKSLSQWHKILGASSLEKHGQLVSLLKKEHGVTHGFANLIVAKFLKGDAESGDAESGDDLVAQQYSAKADLRPIYDALAKKISKFGKDVEFAPKKAYVSLRREKQFGLIQPSTKTRLDVGLNLKGTKVSKRLEKSGSFNAMVTHRVRVSDVSDVDAQLLAWLRDAYERAG